MPNNFRSGLDLKGQPLGETYATVSLSADNQVVNPTSPAMLSRIILQSDNTTASNRTFTLISSSLVGHRLVLYFESGSSYTCQLVNTGNCKLSGNWEPTQYNQIMLESDGTNWVEVARGASVGTVPAGSVALSSLASGIAPSHVVKFGGTFTTAGGDASETITVTGAAATDLVAVTVKTAGATPRSIVAATAATNAINVTMSGDPSTDHVLQYVVFRAAS